MNGDIADEPNEPEKGKMYNGCASCAPQKTIDMSVAGSSKSTLGKYFKGNIMFATNPKQMTMYATLTYMLFLKNIFSILFADRYDIQVGTMISSTVNDLNPRRVDEFLMAFGQTCFKVSCIFKFSEINVRTF